MKSQFVLPALLFVVGSVSLAHADNHTVTLGYAQASVDDFKDVKGFTAKYHYQNENPVGVVGSFTYMGSSETHNYGPEITGTFDLSYYSLLAGPSYRINDVVSVYGLMGAARGKVDISARNNATGERASGSESKTGFAYGLGVQVVPAANWAINVGYEGTKIDEYRVNGFNIGVGYRF